MAAGRVVSGRRSAVNTVAVVGVGRVGFGLSLALARAGMRVLATPHGFLRRSIPVSHRDRALPDLLASPLKRG